MMDSVVGVGCFSYVASTLMTLWQFKTLLFLYTSANNISLLKNVNLHAMFLEILECQHFLPHNRFLLVFHSTSHRNTFLYDQQFVLSLITFCKIRYIHTIQELCPLDCDKRRRSRGTSFVCTETYFRSVESGKKARMKRDTLPLLEHCLFAWRSRQNKMPEKST